MANTPELAPRMKPSLDSETKNTAGLAPSDSLLLCLIRRSLFSFRPSFPFRLPFPPPFRHSRENGNPDRTGSPVKLGMTKNVSFPRKRESRLNGSRIKCGMTGGARSPIRSASLSVEDDTGCVIPAKAGIQTGLDPQSSWG